MTVPYRSQYRNRLQRTAAVAAHSVLRVLRRPLLQVIVPALLIVGGAVWLHHETPEPGVGPAQASVLDFLSQG